MSDTASSIVTVTDLVKRFGDHAAVDGVSFDIREGACMRAHADPRSVEGMARYGISPVGTLAGRCVRSGNGTPTSMRRRLMSRAACGRVGRARPVGSRPTR